MTLYNVEMDGETWAKVKVRQLTSARQRTLLMELLGKVTSGRWGKLFAEKITKTDREHQDKRCAVRRRPQL